jgi:hypothetical protein
MPGLRPRPTLDSVALSASAARDSGRDLGFDDLWLALALSTTVGLAVLVALAVAALWASTREQDDEFGDD